MAAAMRVRISETPVGSAVIGVDEEGALQYLYFAANRTVDEILEMWKGPKERDDTAAPEVVQQIGEYFAGTRRDFDLRLAPNGTPFQMQVWEELRRIPYGKTISYVDLARRVGREKASRAVGQANGANPISLIVPCHRVIGANGKLTGYGGGLPVKQALLRLEQGGYLGF